MNQDSTNYDLLTKYLLGEASPEEQKQVKNWLQESVENRNEFDSLKKLYEATDFTAETIEVDTDKAWRKVKAKMKGEQGGKVIRMDRNSTRNEDSSINFRRYFRIAAIITGFLIVATVLFRIYKTPVNPVQFADLITTNDKLTDTLPDGSVVALNKNTKLTYPIACADGERRVKLSGEAFFDIAKDSTQPFIIEAGNAEVKVVGTSFNVKAYDEIETIEVIVETGIVQLRSMSKKESITLEPGNKGVFTKSTSELSKSSNDEVDYAFWRSHKLTFRNTPLKEVVEVINNYYATNITYENENIGRCRFSSTFENDSLGTILEILSTTFQLEVRNGVNGKVLSGKGCEDAQL